MLSDPKEYLVVRVSFDVERQLVDFLETEGCQAFEVRRTNEACEVLVYASSDEEVNEWSAALTTRFALARVHRVPLSEAWKTDWTRFLKPVKLTPTLTVVPSGSEPPEAEGDTETLWLEPALAFGFGEHETTKLAVTWLQRTLSDMPRVKVLDFGCGTGILGLAALRMGAASVVGIDIDDAAIRVARANARRNNVHAQCVFSTESLSSLDRGFDVVVANIDSRILVQNAESIATRMSRGGRIALTGFLTEHAPNVIRAFRELGVDTARQNVNDGWVLVANWPPAASALAH